MDRPAGTVAPSVRFAEKLTPREAQVLDLVALGMTNEKAAATLGITARTVEVHRLRVMRKLAAENFCQLMWLALTGSQVPSSWSEAYFRDADSLKSDASPHTGQTDIPRCSQSRSAG